MACRKCGKDVPVLKNAPTSEGQEFLGMCKPCIQKAMPIHLIEKRKKESEWIKGLFS